MMVFDPEQRRPLLLFTRGGWSPGVAAHEALHALCMVFSGIGVRSGQSLETPLSADTNEVWAYTLELIVDAVCTAVDAYDSATGGGATTGGDFVI